MELGIKGAAETVVVYENTAAAVGSGALEVFSTPSMIALMEKASRELVQPYLEEGQSTARALRSRTSRLLRSVRTSARRAHWSRSTAVC